MGNGTGQDLVEIHVVGALQGQWFLADALYQCSNGFSGFCTGFRQQVQLHKAGEPHRVEKVHAGTPGQILHRGENVRHRQGGGIGQQQTVRRDDLRQSGEQRLLGGKRLRDGFQYQIAAGKFSGIRRKGDSLFPVCKLLFRQQPSPMLPIHLLL